MRILISDDDGIHATGLNMRERIAQSRSDDFFFVAPETDRSGVAHSLSLADSLRPYMGGLERAPWPRNCRFRQITGRPPAGGLFLCISRAPPQIAREKALQRLIRVCRAFRDGRSPRGIRAGQIDASGGQKPAATKL
jgi:hypothetical protein